jgi:TP901 family phage tail tape measure protein
MKTLSLAGLSATEVSASIQSVLDFAVAGTTDLKTAADVMTSVATAFSLGAQSYNYVGDVISKAAAVSKASVENMGEAFKTASTLNSTYGASLEDVAVGLAALANVGIRGSAAGTALRNMYVDLSGRTKEVREAMKFLKLDLLDQNGRFVDLVEITRRYAESLKDMSGKGRMEAIQAINSERGMKPVVALFDVARKRAKEFGTDIATELDALEGKIKNSAGFMANAAIQLAQTPASQLKSVYATLQATLVETFNGMEPAVLDFTRTLKEMFNSPEFKSGLKTLAVFALDFGRALASLTATVVEHIRVVAVLLATYTAARAALVLYTGSKYYAASATAAASTAKLAEAGATAAVTTATLADTVATKANSAAKVGTLAALAKWLPGVGTAVTVAGIAWSLYSLYADRAKKSNEGLTNIQATKDMIQQLNDRTQALEENTRAMQLNMSVEELRAREQISKTSKAASDDISKQQGVIDKLKVSKASYPYEGARSIVQNQIDVEESKLARLKDIYREVSKEQTRAFERFNAATQASTAATKAKIEEDKKLMVAEFGEGEFGGKGKKGSKTGDSKLGARATLDAIIKREEEQNSALKATQVVTSIFDQADQERAKNLKGLSEQHENILKNYKDLDYAQRNALVGQRAEAEALIEANYQLQVRNVTMRAEYAFTQQRTEALHKEAIATDELANARYKAAKESSRQLQLQEQSFAFDQSVKFNLPAVQAVEKARFAVRASYVEKYRNLEIESGKRISEMRDTEADVDISGELLAAEKAKAMLSADEARALGLASAKAYQEAWDQTTSTIASNFTSKLMDGTLDIKEFMIETFANMVLQPQVNLLMQQGADALLGSAGGWFSTLMGLPSFEGGGSTGTGPRSGGLDGKGGFPALVHPNETIIDHAKAGNGMSSAPVYVTIHNTVGDVATKSMLDQANAATVKQIQAGIARSSRYNGAMAR